AHRFIALGLVLAACSPGDISTVQPGTGEGRIIRTTLTVHASVDSADAALGEALGWQAGVPDVEVRILRNGTAEWLTAQTDAAGTVVFADILPGLYRVYGGRTLTAAEAQAVGQPVRAFGDGRALEVGLETELELLLLADRPGSLVISEIGNSLPVPWEVRDFSAAIGGLYFEVYNNSDATIFLDGKIFGATHWYVSDTDHTPCSASAPIRTDPAGLHSRWLLQFPGTGAEHPIGPGEVRTVAMAAIDHTPVHPTMLDLSGADFEIGGAGIANNPGVPDMLDVGLEGWLPQVLYATLHTFFLGESVDVASLPILFRDFRGRAFARFPRESLIDVVAFRSIWPDLDAEFPFCVPMVHRLFDRYEGALFEIGFAVDPILGMTRSLERKILRIAPDGRIILQNTNTSAVDFFVGTRTPGRLR
ncbi:MAG: hypothetical protein IIC29_10445, partial [Chloroflexi bacterium]|nr:hypothetical protein [Chloroflexota bacterium]